LRAKANGQESQSKVWKLETLSLVTGNRAEMVKLFCYIQQISKSVFPIDIALGENIGDWNFEKRDSSANRGPDQLTLRPDGINNIQMRRRFRF
jgi:hypothetical protein